MSVLGMREDALEILNSAIAEMLPDKAVEKVLSGQEFSDKDRCVVIAIGKAAWTMAKTAADILGDRVDEGLVVTKYEHSEGAIKGFEIIEAGHPLPDMNSEKGASRALEMVSGLSDKDIVVFLISGGGSALFEKPLNGLDLNKIIRITDSLLASGADIVEINSVRKHLSAVKGGRFAQRCGEAKILSVVLSDVIDDRLDSIASGPAYPDDSTSEEALKIVEKYHIDIDDEVRQTLQIETPKRINNCETHITGSVRELCASVARKAEARGYNTYTLTTSMDCEARELGRILSSISKEIHKYSMSEECKFVKPCALIVGGEAVVQLKGNGVGGRNQETALSAARSIRDLSNVVIASVGSDGTDGPTDAAGGIVDGKSYQRMLENQINPDEYLDDNNAYFALKASGDLIITGPTGTNVNDVVLALIK